MTAPRKPMIVLRAGFWRCGIRNDSTGYCSVRYALGRSPREAFVHWQHEFWWNAEWSPDGSALAISFAAANVDPLTMKTLRRVIVDEIDECPFPKIGQNVD